MLFDVSDLELYFEYFYVFEVVPWWTYILSTCPKGNDVVLMVVSGALMLF